MARAVCAGILASLLCFASAQPAIGNMMMRQIDLKHSMNLAGQNLIHMLSPDQDHLPNFWIYVDRSHSGEIRFFAPGHNLGRWWDAMLRLEEATDFDIPPAIEEAMLWNLKRFSTIRTTFACSPSTCREWRGSCSTFIH